MKVAFVANTCWNIYNFRKGLVHHFIKNGHEVIVMAPEDEYTNRIKEWGAKVILTPLDGTSANPLKDLSYLGKLVKSFKAERPDIALSFTIKSNIYSCLAGKFTGTPVICNVSGLGTVFLVQGIAGKAAMMLYKLAFRFCSHLFFQNDDDKELFTSVITIDADKTGVLPGSGINLEEYKQVPIQQSKPNSFVMVSRVIIEKGVREFAEAAAYFTEDQSIQFTLIGKFDETHARSIRKEELDHWVKSKWIDYRDHSDEIVKVMADHQFVVLPSYREGTSRTLLEGAAIGRPLIAADVPGCREVVQDGYNGFLCEVRNSKSLLDKIKLVLSLSEKEIEQMAANSRSLVEETYDERMVIDAYVDVIRRIIH